MSTDLDRELAGAGRDPSRPLDRTALLAVVERRRNGRRALAGAATAAAVVAGVLGVGWLLPDVPDAPIVDQAPSEDPAPGPDTAVPSSPSGSDDGVASSEDPGPPAEDGFRALGLEALGPDVVGLLRSTDGAGGLRVLGSVGGDGVEVVGGTAAGSAPEGLVPVLVDADGRAVFVDQREVDGAVERTLLAFPLDEPFPTVQFGPGDNLTDVLGLDADARAVVGLRNETGRHDLYAVLDGEQLDLLDDQPEGAAWANDVGEAESTLVGVVPLGDDLLLLRVEGDSSTLEAVRSERTLLQVGPERWLAGVGVVGDEVWLLEGRNGPDADGQLVTTFDLLRLEPDSGDVERVATPLGRQLQGSVVQVQVGATDLGPTMLVALVDDDGDEASNLVVDLALAGDLLVPGEHDPDAEPVAGPDGPFALLSTPDLDDGVQRVVRGVFLPQPQ